MRIIILLFFLLFLVRGYTQSKTNQFVPDSSRLKSKITGNIRHFLRWTDRLGDNMLILTISDQLRSPAKKAANGEDCNGNCTDKELYAYHFIGKDSLLWKLADFEKACNYDNLVEFRKDATRLTDLDQNGLAEIWIMYSSACSSDVSPRTLKLIMYQGNKKYAIRGTSQPARNMIDEKLGGKYKPDKEFEKLPPVFTDFAKNLWIKYLYDRP
jgi:hypothetical protein